MLTRANNEYTIHSKRRMTLTLAVVLISSLAHGQTIFKDVTAEAGIQHEFQVYEGMFGGGACVFDFNKDGFEDLFITGGTNDDRLYLNKGDGTFKDIYKTSGLGVTS